MFLLYILIAALALWAFKLIVDVRRLAKTYSTFMSRRPADAASNNQMHVAAR
jgi:hypothetical protein